MANNFTSTIGGVSTSVDLDKAYENLLSSSTALLDLISAFGFVLGLYMIFRGIAMYRAFGQHVTQTSRPGELAGPAMYILVGSLLLYLDTTIEGALITSFGTPDLLKLEGSQSASGVDWDKVLTLVNAYAQVIGYVSVVRGLFLISKSGDPGVQPGVVSKGIVHFIAGILLINIGGTFDILKQTFGLTVEGITVVSR